MLIEFKVGNYRSFKDPQTLSLVAAPLRAKDKRVDANNVIQTEGQPDLLTSAAIYGANASGKSNLIQALSFVRLFVIRSLRQTSQTGGIEVEPFRLSVNTVGKPSFFEAVFIVKGARFRYGFEITEERVEREWLHTVPTTREAMLFERSGDDVELGRRFGEGKELIGLTRPNALFLSVVAQFNGPIASSVVDWFGHLSIETASRGRLWRPSSFGARTERFLEHPERAREINALIQRLDLNIQDIHLEERVVQLPLFVDDEVLAADEPEKPARRQREMRERTITTVRSVHTIYDDEDQPSGDALFDFHEDESEGTRRLFSLAGPLLRALRAGQILIIDELDANLHPLITREIVRLFNDSETNPRGAQLIFATQDTNLLDNELFRRDQIWFVEKNRQGASQLYSLAEFKGVRNDLSFERGYIEGRFGAIPYLNPNKLRALLVEGDGEEV